MEHMLIEMVALSLTVLSTFSVFPAQPQAEVLSSTKSLESTIPEKELIAMLATDEPSAFVDTTVPEEQIVAMLSKPTPTPTQMPTPEPTAVPSPTPTETPPPTPTAMPTPEPTAVPAPVDLEGLFTRFSGEFSVDRELLKRIAACESGFNAGSHNVAHGYAGMYQFAESSWTAVRSRMGADPNPDLRFSAEESIRTAAFHIANGGQGAWPSCN